MDHTAERATEPAARLRARADQLRWTAGRIPLSSFRALLVAGGEATWVGPAADEFRTFVLMRAATLSRLVEDLRRTAATLDRQADALDRAHAGRLPR